MKLRVSGRDHGINRKISGNKSLTSDSIYPRVLKELKDERA